MSIGKGLVLAGLAAAFAAGAMVRGSVEVIPVLNAEAQAAGRVFELRTYTAVPGRFDALNARFRDHTIRIFAKHGISNVTYWTPTEGPLVGNTLIYVLPHASRDAAKKFWAAFVADPEWIKAKADSEAAAGGGSLTTKVEAVFMKATDYSPK